MILELSVLGGAAALLLASIRLRREVFLLAAVMEYTAATCWLMLRDLGLLWPALVIAIVLGLVGIAMTLKGEFVTQKVTTRHSVFRINTNKMPAAESIGP